MASMIMMMVVMMAVMMVVMVMMMAVDTFIRMAIHHMKTRFWICGMIVTPPIGAIRSRNHYKDSRYDNEDNCHGHLNPSP